jgi:MerR family transcriptional regulator, light-induced transcriptional regulator
MSETDFSPSPGADSLALNIAAVERETRIGKDTLRVWERRYGFPHPLRDTNGERLYPLEQVEQLRHIRRLLDAGHRPGRIVGLDLAALTGLNQRPVAAGVVPGAGAAAVGGDPDLEVWMQRVRRHDVAGLRCLLGQALLRHGLGRFVTEVAVPLMSAVGEAWVRGRLQVFEEHLGREALETVLRAALAGTPIPADRNGPRVVLTTLPFEMHGLTLLMAEALLTVESCHCMNLGIQTPLREIANAAQAHRAGIVALSYSAAVSPALLQQSLIELREALPVTVEIWAGTTVPLRREIAGVRRIDRLEHIAAEVRRWRELNGVVLPDPS